MKGRKKLPDAIKRLNGTNQPCRMSGDKPIFQLVDKMPPAPEWMSETGKRVYTDVVKSMIELGLLTVPNFALLVAYAHMLGVHVEAEEMMKNKGRYMPVKDGEGRTVKIIIAPHHRVSMDALDRALRIGAEFGLTPSAQTKIMNLIKPKQEPDPFDLV